MTALRVHFRFYVRGPPTVRSCIFVYQVCVLCGCPAYLCIRSVCCVDACVSSGFVYVCEFLYVLCVFCGLLYECEFLYALSPVGLCSDFLCVCVCVCSAGFC